MKYFVAALAFLAILFAALFWVFSPVQAATILFPVGGGTGSSTLTGILIGNGKAPVRSLTVGSGLSLTGTTLTATGGGTGTVTQVNTTYPVLGGPLTSTGTISLDFGTTTSNTWAGTQTFTNSPVLSTLTAGTVNSTASGSLYSTASSTLALSSSFAYSGTLGSFVGGAGGTLSLAANGVLLNRLNQVGANTVLGNATGATGNVTAIATSSLFQNASASNSGLLTSTDWTTFNSKGSGTVTAVSVASANGFAGSSSGGATPALTLSTSITGLLKGNGTAISAAANGTDYTLITANTCGAGNHVSAITAAGVITCSADTGSGGTGNVATSTTETAGNLAYWTSSGATPATLGKVATTTLAGTGVISISNSPVLIGASPAVVSLTGGSGGQVLGWSNGVPSWVATSSIENLTLTTTGSSGAATLVGTTLNVPVYSGGGTPGGASSTVQYNGNGSFAGNSGLTYTGTNLGVGTSSPFKLLSVAGESYVTGTSTVALGLIVGTSTMGLNVNDFGNAGLGNIVSNWDGRNLLVVGSHGNSAAFSTAGINTFSSRGTSANPTATQANDLIYVMGARGYGTTNYSNGSKAAVIEYAAQNWTDTANGTYITLETTANNSTTRIEALRADQSGNIGIGTTSPYAALSVSSTTTTGPTAVISGQQPLLQIGSSSPTYGYLANDRLNILDKRNDYSAANIYNLSSGNCATADWTAANDLNATALNFGDFGHTSSGFTGVGCTNNPFTGFGANSTYLFDPSGYMDFALGSTSVASFNWFTGGYTAANQVMTLTNAGNLGVGTTTPSQRLSIQGNGLFSGNLSSANLTATGTVTFSALTGTQCLHEISGVVSGTGSDCGGGSGVTGTTGQVAYLSGTNTAIGTSTIFIDTNGRVGIGTTTPYAAFSVNPTGVTGSAARFVVGSSTETNIYVGSNGRVGFGTTITTSPFQFLGASNASPNFSVVDFKSTTGDVNATFSSANGNIAFMGQRNSGSAYFSGPNGFSIDVYGGATSVMFGSNTGTFCAGGIFTSGTCSGAAIFVKPTTLLTGIGSTTPWGLLSVNPSVTGGAVPMFVVGSSTATNFIIDKTGLVGIGTTSPSSLLQLFSTGTTTVSVDTNSTTKGGCLEMKDSDGVGYTYISANNGVLTASTISCK